MRKYFYYMTYDESGAVNHLGNYRFDTNCIEDLVGQTRQNCRDCGVPKGWKILQFERKPPYKFVKVVR